MSSFALPERPRLRPVEAFPMGVPGDRGGSKRLMCLRDPSQLSTHVVGLQPPALFIAGLLDGEHTLSDIQARFVVRYGEALSDGDLEGLLTQLDQSLLLDSPRFAAHREQATRAWDEAPERPYRHADGGYGGDVEGLRERLQGWFTHPEGPGAAAGSAIPAGARLRGLIVPHIDYGRGGPTYAWGYRELQAAADVETVIVLGTSHGPLSQPISLCRKPFATPLGRVDIDHELASQLEQAYGAPLESDGLVHAHEHSLELQAVWLAALAEQRRVRMVPLLCGPLGTSASSSPPYEDAAISRFVAALREVLATSPRRTLLLAAADLAHVGTGFGDRTPPDEAMLSAVEQADREGLARACAGDGRGFYERIRASCDAYRVCGLSPIYLTVEALGGCQGSLLAYKPCVDPKGFRTVTIASAAFYEQEPAEGSQGSAP